MISSFRNMSNSKIGMAIITVIGSLIVFSFAMGDINNVGGSGVGGGSSALAQAGNKPITDAEMSDALQQQLAQIRQQNPEADYADLDAGFESLLDALITERALSAFADEHGFVVSKRLIDAEIARLPGVSGPDGQFSQAGYAAFLSQQRLTDAQLRQAFEVSLLQRLLLVPVTAEVRVPAGIARPYASMQLEQRSAEVVMVPAAPFRDRVEVSDQGIENFYRARAANYTVPERRVLRFAPVTVDSVEIDAPTEEEITAMLEARSAEFEAQDIRTISQVVLPDETTAALVADAAREGSFVDAVTPQGFSAADISVGPQNKDQFASLATDSVADQVFASNVSAGTVLGPIRSSFGWHVVKVDALSLEGGVPAAQARETVIADLTTAATTARLNEVVADFQDMIRDGASFTEAVAEFGLTITDTPAITSAGRNLDDPSYTFPSEYRSVLVNGYQMFAGDDPEAATLPDNRGFAMVALGDIIEAAPAPLADIRDRVRTDYINRQALASARRVAADVQRAMASGTSTEEAIAAAETKENVELPDIRNLAFRRLDLMQFQGNIPAPVQMMFNLVEGQSRVTGDTNNQGVYVVKTTSITPGDATSNPGLVSQTAQGFRQIFGSELAEQFVRAMRDEVGVSRNESNIAATRSRITGGGAQ